MCLLTGSVLSGGQGPLLLRAYAGYTLFLAVNGITECFAFAAMRPNQVRQHSRWMIAFSAIFVAASYLFTQVLGSVGFIMANMANMLARILKRCVGGQKKGEGASDLPRFSLLAHSLASAACLWFGQSSPLTPCVLPLPLPISGHTIVRFVDARPHTRVGGHPLWGALPAWPVWLAYAVAYGAISASEARFGATADNSFKSRLVHIAVGSSALLAVVGIVYTTVSTLPASLRMCAPTHMPHFHTSRTNPCGQRGMRGPAGPIPLSSTLLAVSLSVDAPLTQPSWNERHSLQERRLMADIHALWRPRGRTE